MAAIPGSYDNKCAHGVRHGTYECPECAATSWESKARSLWDKLKTAKARAEAAEARVRELEEALQDLVSWFPEQPCQAEWHIKAGEDGADDAIAHARALLRGEGGK